MMHCLTLLFCRPRVDIHKCVILINIFATVPKLLDKELEVAIKTVIDLNWSKREIVK